MTLKEFFIDNKITIPSKLFGKTHLFLLSLVIIGLILIYYNRKKLFNLKPKTKKRITKILAIILLANMLTLYISTIIFDYFDYKDMLPLHLCYIANYLYIISILFNIEPLYKYSYLLSFLGPIPAIIFFDVPSLWESFNFYLYVISHHFLVLSSYLTFNMYPKKITIKNTITLTIVLNVYYLIMCQFNRVFQTNYCFSNGIPPFIPEIFPFLKKIPTTLTLELTEIFILFLLYKYYNHEEQNLTSLT